LRFDAAGVVCGLANGQSAVKIMGNDDKIVGGTVTTANELPWLVYLLLALRSGGMAACGGSLIDSRWILTAAHCLDEYIKKQYTINRVTAHIRISQIWDNIRITLRKLLLSKKL